MACCESVDPSPQLMCREPWSRPVPQLLRSFTSDLGDIDTDRLTGCSWRHQPPPGTKARFVSEKSVALVIAPAADSHIGKEIVSALYLNEDLAAVLVTDLATSVIFTVVAGCAKPIALLAGNADE